jgi:hypothetical protein
VVGLVLRFLPLETAVAALEFCSLPEGTFGFSENSVLGMLSALFDNLSIVAIATGFADDTPCAVFAGTEVGCGE